MVLGVGAVATGHAAAERRILDRTVGGLGLGAKRQRRFFARNMLMKTLNKYQQYGCSNEESFRFNFLQERRSRPTVLFSVPLSQTDRRSA